MNNTALFSPWPQLLSPAWYALGFELGDDGFYESKEEDYNPAPYWS